LTKFARKRAFLNVGEIKAKIDISTGRWFAGMNPSNVLIKFPLGFEPGDIMKIVNMTIMKIM
jgi:hypothetical protein